MSFLRFGYLPSRSIVIVLISAAGVFPSSIGIRADIIVAQPSPYLNNVVNLDLYVSPLVGFLS